MHHCSAALLPIHTPIHREANQSQPTYTGINIVLISRTESKLKDAAAELESKYKVQTSYLAADLTACTDAKWTEIKNALDAVEVGLLINNAGISYTHAEYTDAVDDKLVDDMIEMNMRALTKVLKWCLCDVLCNAYTPIVSMQTIHNYTCTITHAQNAESHTSHHHPHT